MSEDLIRYDTLIETALREVVKQAMGKIVEKGLPGDHHFYISFLTNHPGVEIPDYLREKYPEEMTIVLQHQFYGLKTTENGFSVMLSFNNIQERLTIPFSAITTFADPSVNFALQFQSIPFEDMEEPPQDGESLVKDGDEKQQSKVISLDQFRKK